MLKFILSVALCFVMHLLCAQNNEYQFSQLDISNGLSNNRVNCIYKDVQGFIWFGTTSGLSRYDSYEFKNFKHNAADSQSLCSNYVEKINEGPENKLWIFTKNGISIYDPLVEKFSNDVDKELSSYHIQTHHLKSIKKDASGNFWFLTNEGVYYWNSKSKNSNFYSTAKTSKIALHSNNITEIISAKNSTAWFIYSDGMIDKIATNTSEILLRGAELFQATDTNNPTNVGTAMLSITVLPPFWKSPLAYFLYIFCGIFLLFFIQHRGILKLKRAFKISQDKIEAERQSASKIEAASRMHELDLMKIKFFTNVSHEFRTPLSLITSPIDMLIKNNQNPEQQNQLAIIQRNSRRLLNLVNQLLDFRKMESNELKLNLEKGNLICFIKEVSASFADLAEQKQITYHIESEIHSLPTRFDYDKIERILFNLIFNAFKFTPSGGQISVHLKLADKNSIGPEPEKLLEIKVTDTGIGIPKDKLEHIFERFYQVNLPEGLLNQGSGIGLSISREFVKMHSGEIYAESEPGNGSCFTIKLPISIETGLADGGLPVIAAHKGAVKPAEKPSLQKKLTVLIIDESNDLRFYLKDNLKSSFNIIEATNGKEGWQKALALHPNLIVSDVNMPEMNGLDLCKKIKSDNRTSHIPLILLTALTLEEDQLLGLTNGANDYISKPFNFEILLSKINGLLQMQETFKKTYQKQHKISMPDLAVVSEDEKFLKRVFDCIEANITNYNFSVEELSRQMLLSRVSLYKRLLALTGKTPIDCIRTVRLKRALQLLEKSKLGIAGIAYEVGFNNPIYFSKVFKGEYGVVPSEYFNRLRQKGKLQSSPDD